MARPKKITEPLKVQEVPTSIQNTTPLSSEERKELRALLNSTIFVRAWNVASSAKPSLFRRDGQFDGPLGNQLAANRLCQLQGWELFSAALLTQVNDPKPPKQDIPYTYNSTE
jgi:hypothetical protein